MQIEICGRGPNISDRLRKHIERRVHFALQRFEQHIRTLRVRCRDLNGPRGGIDKSCQLTISLSPAATMVMENRSGSAYAAVNRVVDKAAISIARRIKRSDERGKDERILKYLLPKERVRSTRRSCWS